MIMTIEIKLRIKDAFKGDFGKGIAQIDPKIVSESNIDVGDTICIYNESKKKFTAAIVFPSDPRDEGTNIIRIDALLRRNLKATLEDIVKIKKTKNHLAQQVSFAGYKKEIILKNPDGLVKTLKDRVVSKGDIFTFRCENKKVDLIVINHTPQTEVVKIHNGTNIFCQKQAYYL